MLQRLWAQGDHVLAAVSGGADSVALLRMLHEIAQRGEIRLSCAHLDHGIRGEESTRDAAFVRSLCERLGVPLRIEHLDVPGLAKQNHMGIEEAARVYRYAFLYETAMDLRAQHVALAHHMDDQAETVLMHMLRGAGTEGVSGMRPVEHEGLYIRPLLHVTKAELLEYLKEQGQSFVTDHTNFLPIGPRNRLRLEVMPLLKDIYPGTVSAICRFATIAAGESELVWKLAYDWFKAHARTLPMGALIVPDPRAEPALVRRALDWYLGVHGFEAVERALGMYESPQAARAELSGGRQIERAGRGLYILENHAKPPAPVPLTDGAKLDDYCAIHMQPAEPIPIRDDPYRQVLDAQALKGAELRPRRPGDRFRMLNAPGDKLLSDVLIDRKIDRPLRDWLPLVAVGERVLWIPGVGVSEQAKVVPGCRAAMLTYEGDKLV